MAKRSNTLSIIISGDTSASVQENGPLSGEQSQNESTERFTITTRIMPSVDAYVARNVWRVTFCSLPYNTIRGIVQPFRCPPRCASKIFLMPTSAKIPCRDVSKRRGHRTVPRPLSGG